MKLSVSVASVLRHDGFDFEWTARTWRYLSRRALLLTSSAAAKAAADPSAEPSTEEEPFTEPSIEPRTERLGGLSDGAVVNGEAS